MGTVVKAAAEGELAGIGKLGVAGKTICKHCNVKTQCLRHPNMMELIRQYAQPYEQRDYRRVAAVAAAAE